MLRWLQSTVRIRHDYGGPCIRSNLCQATYYKDAFFLTAAKLKSSVSEPVTSRASNPHCASRGLRILSSVARAEGGHHPPGSEASLDDTSITAVASSRTDASHIHLDKHGGNRDDVELLCRYLSSSGTESLNPEDLVTLYESAKARSLLSQLNATQLSTLIGIFGALSLPPDAPRITNQFLTKMEKISSTSYWPLVLEIVTVKEVLGFGIGNGDHYWMMWARISEFRALSAEHATQGSLLRISGWELCSENHSAVTDRASRALAHAKMHYRKIWPKTKVPDILVPYFEALLSSGDPRHITDCIHDVLEVLTKHKDLHGRFLRLIWHIFLKCKDDLTSSVKEELLFCLWSRLSSTNGSSSSGRYVATHRFNPLTKRHERLPLDISQLISVLGAPLFPFFEISVPISVRQWARHQVESVLSPERSVDSRWRSFSFLSLNHLARNGSYDAPALDEEPDLSDWHVILLLGLLENAVVPTTQAEEVQSIIHPLWQRWKDITASGVKRSIFVNRAVTSAFLRLAGQIHDEYIRKECYHYSLAQGLWAIDTHQTGADRAQVGALMRDYAEATVHCRGLFWLPILRSFDPWSTTEASKLSWRAEVLIQQFLSSNSDFALSLYQTCSRSGISVSDEAAYLVGLEMASSHVEAIIPILKHSQLTSAQTGNLLHAILDSLRLQRRRYLDAGSGRALASAMQSLFQHQTPAYRMMYPVRYSLPLLITAGCASETLKIMELVHPRAQFLFNERFLHRMLRTLLRYRHYTLAVRLYRLSKDKAAVVRNRLRRQLVLGLVHGGASFLAKKYYSKFPLSSREKMAHLVRFRVHTPRRSSSMKVFSLLRENPTHVPSIKFAFMILINSKRYLSALRLFQHSTSYLNVAETTWFGNVFLHRIILRFRTRNAQKLKKVLSTKKFLEQRVGFSADRVTLNILVKAMLHWKTSVDSNKVRNLFDDMIRIGYPAAIRWRRENMVPFGTRPIRSSLTLGLSNLPDSISFKQHVRPMYKMFIKAFYLRGDAAAAKMVIGIMKDEEVAELWRQQYRNRRRFEGLRLQKSQSAKKKNGSKSREEP